MLTLVEQNQSLVDMAGKLHEEIEQKTKELKDIKSKLAEQAEYKPGVKTGHIYGQAYSATVQLKEYVKWDQQVLDNLRLKMGDIEFFKVFKWEFEPISKKLLDGALEFGQYGADIRTAFTTTAGSPQISFKKLEAD
jgi:hypothetical protein